MEKSKSIQRNVVRPLVPSRMPKGPSHRACLRTAGLAIASVVADKRVPLNVVKRDLEDLKETIDFALNVVSMGLLEQDQIH